MRAFVAGATGYTGRAVVGELITRGVTVYAHVRPESPRLAEWRARFERLGAVVDVTPWDRQSIRDSLQHIQPDHVFALLGTTRARAREAASRGSDASYEAVDYGLTALLLEATREARFIYLSSLGVSARARNPYLAVRWRLESELKTSGLSYIIARPSFITGSDREEFRFGERAAAGLADKVLEAAGLIGMKSLHDRFASMTGQQLAKALVCAALDEKCRNTILETPQLRALAGC
ncbi:MAG TPA: NAD(P)H-binding protein [Longimicrobiales bacterium]